MNDDCDMLSQCVTVEKTLHQLALVTPVLTHLTRDHTNLHQLAACLSPAALIASFPPHQHVTNARVSSRRCALPTKDASTGMSLARNAPIEIC